MALLIFGGITLLIYWHLDFVLQLLLSIFIAFFVVSTLLAIAQLVFILYPQDNSNQKPSLGQNIQALAYKIKKFFSKKKHTNSYA